MSRSVPCITDFLPLSISSRVSFRSKKERFLSSEGLSQAEIHRNFQHNTGTVLQPSMNLRKSLINNCTSGRRKGPEHGHPDARRRQQLVVTLCMQARTLFC